MNHVAVERPYTVVAGVDGSPSGQAALRWAIDEAHCRKGRVRAIHTWTSPYDVQTDFVFPVDEEALRNAAQQRLDDALARVDARDVPIDAELIEGDARHVLVDAANEADLLVVGSHGRGRVTEALLGSVSTFCVHHVTGPVVVVRGDGSREVAPS